MKKIRVIAAARCEEDVESSVNSGVETVFMLSPNISTIKAQTELVHSKGKKIFVHLDLAEGIGKDEYGILYLKEMGVDGIISTRTNIIKMAKKNGMFTVQRFFIVDSHSLDTAVETARLSKPDMIEIMPGTLSKVIKNLKKDLDMPIVAGGLIETREELEEAMKFGAFAVSTGKRVFWGC